MKIQQTQVQQDRTKTLTELRKDGQVKLKRGEEYGLTDMVVNVNVLNSRLHLLDLGVRLLDVCYLFT
jgi:hypothetical protein